MKRIYIGILAVLYLAVSSGIAMELHYCMGKKAGMDLYWADSDKCGKCGMPEKDKAGCCHDEFKFYKLSDFHKTVSNDIDLTASSFAVVNDHHLFNWQLPVNTVVTSENNNSPPGYASPSACILNCVFRL
jgi:hypothetical protein